MMFGHNDEQHDQNGPTPDETLAHNEEASTALPPADHAMSSNDNTAAPAQDDASDAGDYIMTDSPVAAPPQQDEPITVTPTAPVTPHATDADSLLSIKQQALQQLSPLVGHLDQSAEEKFRTTMMLIQAADNDKLIPQAYESAQAITDDKARAQALLDVVNEINYFTQQTEQQ
jgi:hypothetical protein